MQKISFHAMWAYGQHFRIENNDDKRVIFDYGVMANFDQGSHASLRDTNLIQGTLKYVGKIQEIIQLDYRSLQCVILKCKWFETLDRRTILHDRLSDYFAIDFTCILLDNKEPYILS